MITKCVSIRNAGKVLLCAVAMNVSQAHAQQMNYDGAENLPRIVNADIKGAPKLAQPALIKAAKDGTPLISEGHGWAAPGMFDWNKDGKMDLLIGEFTSGMEFNKPVGNFIRVYENTGSATEPVFRNEFGYARMVEEDHAALNWRKTPEKYPSQLVYFGTPISIPQFCCMAFHPQFADINNDGFPDLCAGSYSPGEVFWFRGSELGFLQGEKLKQYGNSSPHKTKHAGDMKDTSDWHYWYSAQVSFDDLTGDGLKDMVVGGFGGLRLSKNTGTAQFPEFGFREPLLDINGKPLWGRERREPATPFLTDWDNDGVTDLLVSTAYVKKGSKAVIFYKGVKAKDGFRFHEGISLFETADGSKIFPGDHLVLSVGDWNSDGIKDLIIGTKIAMVDKRFHKEINWGWEQISLKSNPGYYPAEEHAMIEEKIRKAEKREAEVGVAEMNRLKNSSNLVAVINDNTTKQEHLNWYYGGKEEYKTLIHHGVVYLLLGQKR